MNVDENCTCLDVVFDETRTQIKGILLGSDQMRNEVLPKATSLKTSCKRSFINAYFLNPVSLAAVTSDFLFFFFF